MDQNESKMQIAVLIDSENVSSRYASIIFNEIETYGFATYRRIYGNWTKNNGWSENILLENSITPIQQFNYTSGKNSSDMTMVIDAMDILYSGNVDGFCLVTSDSDFTRLAMRLREANMYVIGMGESKTPAALTKACNKFIHLNLILKQVLPFPKVRPPNCMKTFPPTAASKRMQSPRSLISKKPSFLSSTIMKTKGNSPIWEKSAAV